MKYPIYCMRDAKIGFDSRIWCDQGDQSAIRGFSYSINGNDGLMNYSPADFDLYKIGEFDSETGKIDAIVPDIVCSGASVFKEK